MSMFQSSDHWMMWERKNCYECKLGQCLNDEEYFPTRENGDCVILSAIYESLVGDDVPESIERMARGRQIGDAFICMEKVIPCAHNTADVIRYDGVWFYMECTWGCGERFKVKR